MAIARWQTFTGRHAIHEASGQSYGERKAAVVEAKGDVVE